MALDRLNNIVGTPTQLGTFSFTLQITDSAHPSQTAQVPLALNVVPPRVSASTSWNGVFGITSIPVGRPFTGYVEASGGIPPFSYSSTAAPPGLSFDPNTATFSGSPITAGDYSSQIVVTDSLNSTANLTASFHIIPAKGRNDDIAHATVYNPLGSGMTGSISPYQDLNHPDNDYFLLYGRASQTITVTVSDSSSGALVPGLELLDANGNRFQTCGPQFQSPCVGHGDSSASYISLQATVPGSGNQTSPLYAHVFDWRGDSRPDMTFYISAVNNQLPLDVSQIPSTSYILSNTAQTTTPLNPVGGTFPFTWTLVSGSLPSGWVLNPGTGSITVPPSAPGTYNVVYQVADSSNPQMTAQLPMRYIVHDQLAIVQSVLPHAKVGVPYTYQFTATGGVAPFNWGISIFLPDPLSLGFPSQTGIIQFTPSVAGQAGVSAGVNSADNEFAFASFTIIIDP